MKNLPHRTCIVEIDNHSEVFKGQILHIVKEDYEYIIAKTVKTSKTIVLKKTDVRIL